MNNRMRGEGAFANVGVTPHPEWKLKVRSREDDSGFDHTDGISSMSKSEKSTYTCSEYEIRQLFGLSTGDQIIGALNESTWAVCHLAMLCYRPCC